MKLSRGAVVRLAEGFDSHDMTSLPRSAVAILIDGELRVCATMRSGDIGVVLDADDPTGQVCLAMNDHRRGWVFELYLMEI